MQALVALTLFALGALSLTSISVRQLVATRQAAKALARDQLAESTIASLESAPYDLAMGSKPMETVVVDGLTFRREAVVSEEEGGKLLKITLNLWIEEDGKRKSPLWSYQKKVLRL